MESIVRFGPPWFLLIVFDLREYIFYCSEGGFDGAITPMTAKNIAEIPNFNNLKLFQLTEIPQAFDFETFFNGLKVRHKFFI